jgi:hypothetical protein
MEEHQTNKRQNDKNNLVITRADKGSTLVITEKKL